MNTILALLGLGTMGPVASSSVAPTLAEDGAVGTDVRVSPEKSFWGVSLGLGTLSIADSGFDVVAEVPVMPRVEILVERFFGRPDDGLSAHLGLGIGGQGARLLSRYESQFVMSTLKLGLTYRKPIWGVLGVYGSGAAGMELAQISVDADGRGPRLEDEALAWSGTFLAGLEFAIPYHGSHSVQGYQADRWIVLSAGGGYLLATDFAFDDLRRDVDSDTEPERVEDRPVDLGELSPGGALFMLSASMWF